MADIKGYNMPDELYYHKDHAWARVEGTKVTVGMNDFFQKESGDIVFVDLPGGSCTISCYNILKEYKDLNIICGINLPILMEFFMLREKYLAKELADILVKKGKDNIFRLEHKK